MSPLWPVTARWPRVAAPLLGAVLAAQDDLGTRVKLGLERARPVLVRELETADRGELALLCLAALHDGVPRDERPFAAALERLTRANLAGTYELSLRLMVLAEADWLEHRQELARKDCERLLQNQAGSGGFGYHKNPSWDLSNTQYAALGLRAACTLGCVVLQRRWQRLCDEVLAAQNADGGFGYREHHGSTCSMTVAGIAVLEICRQHLKLSTKGTKELERAVTEAWEWSGGHAGEIGAAARGAWAYYFLYGLERAAILSDRAEVGGIDWYRAGAERLLRDQGGDGSWDNGFALRGKGDPVSSAFAVLFLRKKFQRFGPVTQAGGFLAAGLPERATDEQIHQAVETETRRGIAAVPDLLHGLRSPILARRRAAALALAGFAGQDFGYHPLRDEAQNAEAIKRAELWWLRR